MQQAMGAKKRSYEEMNPQQPDDSHFYDDSQVDTIITEKDLFESRRVVGPFFYKLGSAVDERLSVCNACGQHTSEHIVVACANCKSTRAPSLGHGTLICSVTKETVSLCVACDECYYFGKRM